MVVKHKGRGLNFNEANSIRSEQVLIPDSDKDFLRRIFYGELEFICPNRLLTSVALDLGLQLSFLVSQCNIGTHGAHKLSISNEFGFANFYV
jgi:hypothetical protein